MIDKNCETHKHTHREQPEIIDLTNRLNRLEGQVRGIKAMVESDAYCDDVLIQVAAVKSALDAFASQLFTQHIKTCVIRDIHAGKEDIVNELITTVKRLTR